MFFITKVQSYIKEFSALFPLNGQEKSFLMYPLLPQEIQRKGRKNGQ